MFKDNTRNVKNDTEINTVPVQVGVRNPTKSWYEVYYEPDILASSPGQCNGR
jgi:hypothetical protein